MSKWHTNDILLAYPEGKQEEMNRKVCQNGILLAYSVRKMKRNNKKDIEKYVKMTYKWHTKYVKIAYF